MIDLVYKLNLPNAKEIFVQSKIKEAYNHVPLKNLNPKIFLKEEWQSIKNYHFNSVVVFYKEMGQQTNIHSDMTVAESSNYDWSFWAINWLDGGDTLMEYWNYEDLKLTKYIEKKNPYHLIPCYEPLSSPIKSYTLTPGAYLTNIEIPHRATGYSKRHNFSIRSSLNKSSTWENIVEEFKDLII